MRRAVPGWRGGAVAAGLLAALVVACGGSEGSAGTTPAPGLARLDRWVPLASSTVARGEVGAARAGRFAYVVGGFLPGAHPTTGLVERYDLIADRWRRIRALPTPVNHPAAATYRGDLYVVGGYTANAGLTGETRAFWRYDVAHDAWRRMPSAPTARGALGAAVIGDRLYAAGGAAGGRALARLEIFDFTTRRWRRGPDMAVAREHIGATASAGALYVVGGRPGDLRVAERYVPGRRRWERLPDMITGRSGIAAVALPDGRIVAFGGETGGGTIRPVEAYDPARRRWRGLPGMRTPRHGLGGAALGNRVFALEGGVRPGFSSSRLVEALDVPAR
jgi:serine/threonine-protein kinase PknK